MKVKIQFTVDIEEVPSEVNKRIKLTLDDSKKIVGELEAIISNINTNNNLQSLDDIDSLRKKLAYIDSVLDDSYSVLSGYVKYKTGNLEQSNIKEERVEQ